jgi:hypothetical protein
MPATPDRNNGYISYSCGMDDRLEHLRCSSAPDRPMIWRELPVTRTAPDCTCDCHDPIIVPESISIEPKPPLFT